MYSLSAQWNDRWITTCAAYWNFAPYQNSRKADICKFVDIYIIAIVANNNGSENVALGFSRACACWHVPFVVVFGELLVTQKPHRCGIRSKMRQKTNADVANLYVVAVSLWLLSIIRSTSLAC